MDITEAKKQVIAAGNRLVETGLIARTWGNVSCRIDSESFVITPSGKAYDSLTEDDIVLVKIADLAYDGDVKPSSEKGVHAECYKLRPDCNFVIHTHQKNASAVSTLGKDIDVIGDRAKGIIGDVVPSAAYGLPGTGKLKNGVAAAIAGSSSKAIIMRHHGAVCMGASYEEAFAVAAELETVCMRYINSRLREFSVRELADDAAETFKDIIELLNVSAKSGKACPDFEKFDSVRDGENIILTSEKYDDVTIPLDSAVSSKEPYAASFNLHKAVYDKRKDINAIISSKSEIVTERSKNPAKVRPLLDDFAQLVGINLKNTNYDFTKCGSAERAARAMTLRNAVLLKDNGALCASGDKEDAEAVEMVLEKDLKAQAVHELCGINGGYIGLVDSVLMRVIYKLKYSKQK